MSEETNERPYVCEEPGCGRTFTRPQGLGRHMKESHGATTTREAAAAQTAPPAQPVLGWYETQVRERLREMAEPLKEQLAEIDARLETLTAEIAELRKGRGEIVAVLSRLDPQEAAAKKKPATGHANGAAVAAAKQLDEKTEQVEAIIKRSPERFANGFTANVLAETLTKEVTRGLSVQSAMKVIERLRERNLVRADRVTRGGGMSYQLVGNGNGGT